MEERGKLRSLIAGVLLCALVLATPLALTGSEGEITPGASDPIILLDGVRLQLDEDGNIQALIDVWAEHVNYSHGFVFYIKYDDTRLLPSDYYTNETIESTSLSAMSGANQNCFIYNEELCTIDGSSVNPFAETAAMPESTAYTYYRQLDTTAKLMQLTLFIDQTELLQYYRSATAAGKTITGNLHLLQNVGESADSQTSPRLAFANYTSGNEVESAPENIRIKLGTLSFRIPNDESAEQSDRDILRKLVEECEEDYYWYKPGSTSQTEAGVWGKSPLYASIEKATALEGGNYKNAWTIWYYGKDTVVTPSGTFGQDVYSSRKYQAPTDAAIHIHYDFGNGLISAELLQPEITINAYRAYSYPGTDRAAAYQNVAAALRKYSPTVVANYADGTVRNFVMNWGASGTDYNFRVFTKVENAGLLANVQANPDAYPNYLVHADTIITYETQTVEITDGSGNTTTQTEQVPVETTTYSLWQDIESIEPFEYNPRGGEYVATQYFRYPTGETDESGAPLYDFYPNPLEAHLTVTPVEVERISAVGLEREYSFDKAAELKEIDELKLPDELRIVTKQDSGAPGLFLTIGGAGEDLPGWTPVAENIVGVEVSPTPSALPSVEKTEKLRPSADSTDKWPQTEDATGGAGTYTFKLAGESGALYKEKILGDGDIRAKYPWLTSGDFPISAVRTVLAAGETPRATADDYRAKWVSTEAADYSEIMSFTTNNEKEYTGDGLMLTLAVAHFNSDTPFGEHAAFRILMPNGQMIQTGINDGTDWFALPTGESVHPDLASYSVEFNQSVEGLTTMGDTAARITIRPGVTSDESATGEFKDERAELRRMINLGGYFEISVCEDTTAANQSWSEYISVYAEPRANSYEEKKTYNFIGLNSGLIDYYGASNGLSDTLTLPQGEYYPVVTSGERANTLESEPVDYGVLTTYDGETGEQPGRVYTFSVLHSASANDAKNIWDVEKPDSTITDSSVLAAFNNVTISRYNSEGKNDFDTTAQGAYGVVENKSVETDKSAPYEPVVRVQEPGDGVSIDRPLERIEVIYEGESTTNVTSDAGGQVTEVLFDTETEGYTLRRSYVLTIWNRGDVDVDGLYVDTLTESAEDKYTKDGGGGHFEVTDPPAAFLAAGCKTTFTLTYVYDLKADMDGGPIDYLDEIKVCSNLHDASDPLRAFDARFTVTTETVNRVTVRVMPPFLDKDGNIFYLGEAGVIVGPPDGGGAVDYSYTSTTRAEGTKVYIGVFPYEEYEVEEVCYESGGELRSILSSQLSGEDVYHFNMPARNVTVYVILNEPTTSKLRPSELHVYAGETADQARDRAQRATTEKVLWQKSFSDAEISAATKGGAVVDTELMKGGVVSAAGYDSLSNHYLVILNEQEAYVQAEAILRKVVAMSASNVIDGVEQDFSRNALNAIGYTKWFHYENLDILNNIEVEMKVGGEDTKLEDYTPVYRYDPEPDNCIGDDDAAGPHSAHLGYTSDGVEGNEQPSSHTSVVFDAPAVGGREWLIITISYNDDTATYSRSYYVELVRRPSYSVTLSFGNSPVGMIWNTKSLRATDTGGELLRELNTDGQSALQSFAKNRTLGLATLPYAFGKDTNNLDSSKTYNREAWVEMGRLYDPDSLTSTDAYSIGVDAEGNVLRDSDLIGENGNYDFGAVAEYSDLDLDPYSLFVLLGEDFTDPGLDEIRDSSMRTVEPERVSRYLEGFVTMDGSSLTASEKSRFEGGKPTAERIYLGTLADSAAIKSEDWQATHAYPQTTYEYDGVKYPVYCDPTTDETYFFVKSTLEGEESGGFFAVNDSNHKQLTDAEIIARLKEKYDDEKTPIYIRPGVYTLVYEFPDFDSEVAGSPALRTTRKVVVLGRVGDVDADNTPRSDAAADAANASPSPSPAAGAKTVTSDETLIERRVSSPLGYDASPTYSGASAYKYRTVDVNNDRNINNIDANELHSRLDKLSEFYAPVDYSDLKSEEVSG